MGSRNGVEASVLEGSVGCRRWQCSGGVKFTELRHLWRVACRARSCGLSTRCSGRVLGVCIPCGVWFGKDGREI